MGERPHCTAPPCTAPAHKYAHRWAGGRRATVFAEAARTSLPELSSAANTGTDRCSSSCQAALVEMSRTCRQDARRAQRTGSRQR